MRLTLRVGGLRCGGVGPLAQILYEIGVALGAGFPFGGFDDFAAVGAGAQGEFVVFGAAAIFVGDDAPDGSAVFGHC